MPLHTFRLMKVFVLLPALLCAFILTQRAMAQAPNLLLNGGFETASPQYPGVGQYWETNDAQSHPETCILDSSIRYSGNYSQKLQPPPGGEWDVGAVRQVTNYNTVTAGKRYEISAWIKTQGINNPAGWYILGIWWFNNDSWNGDVKNPAQSPLNHDWKQITFSAVAPANTNRAAAFLTRHTDGTVWYDDVILREVVSTSTPTNTPFPSSTPTRTATPTPTRTATHTPTSIPTSPPCSNNIVFNGDFSSGDPGWTNWTERTSGSITRNFASSNPPAGGSSPALEMYTTDSNGGVYQTLALTAGQSYSVRLVVRDLGSTPNAAWAEVLVGTVQPVDGIDYGPGTQPSTIELQKWDTFGTCGTGWNGTPGCITNVTSFLATADTMYLVLKLGETSGGTAHVSYDNVEVCGPPHVVSSVQSKDWKIQR